MTTSTCESCGERYRLSDSYTSVAVDFKGQENRDDFDLDLCQDCGLVLLRDLRSVYESGRSQRRASP